MGLYVDGRIHATEHPAVHVSLEATVARTRERQVGPPRTVVPGMASFGSIYIAEISHGLSFVAVDVHRLHIRIYIGCPTNQGSRDDVLYLPAIANSVNQLIANVADPVM